MRLKQHAPRAGGRVELQHLDRRRHEQRRRRDAAVAVAAAVRDGNAAGPAEAADGGRAHPAARHLQPPCAVEVLQRRGAEVDRRQRPEGTVPKADAAVGAAADEPGAAVAAARAERAHGSVVRRLTPQQLAAEHGVRGERAVGGAGDAAARVAAEVLQRRLLAIIPAAAEVDGARRRRRARRLRLRRLQEGELAGAAGSDRPEFQRRVARARDPARAVGRTQEERDAARGRRAPGRARCTRPRASARAPGARPTAPRARAAARRPPARARARRRRRAPPGARATRGCRAWRATTRAARAATSASRSRRARGRRTARLLPMCGRGRSGRRPRRGSCPPPGRRSSRVGSSAILEALEVAAKGAWPSAVIV